MQLDGVHHIGMNVQNLDRAEKFYAEVLGFHVAERYAEEICHLMLDTGSTKLHLFESPALEMQEAINQLSEQGYAHIAFGTCREKFPKIITELKNNNIEFRGPLFIRQGRIGSFQRP